MVISTTTGPSGQTSGDSQTCGDSQTSGDGRTVGERQAASDGQNPIAAWQPGPFEPGHDPLSPNRNLAPISTRVDLLGRLEVGGCVLSDLADTWGTPLYVLDEATLRAACRAYRQALETFYPGPSLALYASKANSSLAITALVASEGLGLDAVSAGELLTALDGGMPPERIVLHGNNKSREELQLAVERGVTVVLDNWNDIRLLSQLAAGRAEPVRLLLRFTPGIECHTHEYIRTGHLDSKFGFDPDELPAVLEHLAGCAWARLDGLHAHIGSQIFELQPHQDLAAVLADALALARRLGHPCGDLNVGGGLGIRYVASDDPPSIQDWVKQVATAVAKACRERQLTLPRLLCEPGRSLVASAGVTLYRLGSRKPIPGLRTYLSVDGGMSDNPRPITYQSRYTAVLADRPLAPADETVTLAGKHCESGDVLLRDLALPASAPDQVLVVFATGAYNAAMGSNYNRIPRPAAVLVGEGEAELVQRREQPEDLLRYDVLPARLEPLRSTH
jgi:diaminopimelate decarboxylase